MGRDVGKYNATIGNAETDYFWRGSTSLEPINETRKEGRRVCIPTFQLVITTVINDFIFPPFATVINSSVLKASWIVCFVPINVIYLALNNGI